MYSVNFVRENPDANFKFAKKSNLLTIDHLLAPCEHLTLYQKTEDSCHTNFANGFNTRFDFEYVHVHVLDHGSSFAGDIRTRNCQVSSLFYDLSLQLIQSI